MNKIKFVSLAASLALAMAFTLSCSSDDSKEDKVSSSSSGSESSSSVGDVSSSSVGGASSSSGGGGSSSSEESSSSSGEEPSSSSETLSSSSAEAGNSSSSAEEPSSSSETSSSSAEEPCTASDNTETEYCSEGAMKKYGSVNIGGNAYKTVVIGTQTWMAKNLNYEASGSKCPSNKSENCDTYGRLYDWNTASTICPSGWHLPSMDEWDELVNFVGGEEIAGKKLKAASGWKEHGGASGNGTDDYGFSALPGGDGDFGGVGVSGLLWARDELAIGGDNYVFLLQMDNDYDGVTWNGSPYNEFQVSVRCIKY